MSDKNKEIKEAIIGYIQKYGYPPTISEIGEMVGFRSKNTTWNHLQQMLKSGELVTDHPYSARAIRVPEYEFVKKK